MYICIPIDLHCFLQTTTKTVFSTVKRSIVHMDLDTFFVSCERLLDSRLIGKPILIGSTSDRGWWLPVATKPSIWNSLSHAYANGAAALS